MASGRSRRNAWAAERRPMTVPALRLSVFIAALFVVTAAAAQAPRYSDAGPEPMLARIFEQIEANQIEPALQQTEALIRAYPNFRVAHLIKGDLLLARSRTIKTIGNAENAPADKLADLRDEAIARLKAYRNRPPANYVPRYLMQLQAGQKFAIVVDTQKSRLYLYEND